MIDETLKKSEDSIITIAELERQLPLRVDQDALRIILGHLEKSNKIVITSKGITWIGNESNNLKKAIAEGLEL